MAGSPNRSTPQPVGNLQENLEELLRAEGILSDRLLSSAQIINSDNRLQGRAGDVESFDRFNEIVREADSSSVFLEPFIQLAWGSSDGTGYASELSNVFQEAVSNAAAQDPEVAEKIERFLEFYIGSDETSGMQAAMVQEMSHYSTKPVEKLNYVVLKSNNLDMSNANADLLALWLRGIPTTDISRAYPFLRIKILQASDTVEAGSLPPMSWEFSLRDNDSRSRSPERDYSWTESGEASDLFTRGSRNNPAPQPSAFSAFPDVMNAPQTFMSKREDVLNPQAPQLGLIGFSVSTSPTGYGMIANRSANLSLRLFDRSRLRDIAPLISPKFRGSVAFEIEWGWKCDIAEHMHTPYTRLLDTLRVREFYSLISPNFSFQDDGSVNIEMRLNLRPQRILENTNITVGAIQNVQDVEGVNSQGRSLNHLEGQITRLAEELQSILSSSGVRDGAVTVTDTNFLGRFSSVEDILNIRDGDPIIKEIRDFIEAYHPDVARRTAAGRGVSSTSAPRQNPTSNNENRFTRLIEILTEIFGEYTEVTRAEMARAGSGRD